jgi:MFS family permease
MPPQIQIAFLNAAHFACHYFLLIFPTAVIAIERERGIEFGTALTLGAPMYICFALGTLPAGWLGDRWNSERLIGFFFVGCGLSGVVIALTVGDLGMLIGMGMLGLFASIFHPVGLSMLTKLSDQPGRTLAVNGVYGNLGLAFASLLTGLIADSFGWRGAYLIPAIISISIGLKYFRAQRSFITGADTSAQSLNSFEVAPHKFVQIRVIAVVLLAALFSGLIFNGVTISLPKLLDERLNGIVLSLSDIGGYVAIVFAVAAFAQLPVGILLDRFGGRAVLIALFAFEICALAVMSLMKGILIIPTALVTVTLMFAGIPITGWLLGRYVAISWRSRAFAAEYVLSLGMSAVIVPIMATLHQTGHGFDQQYLLFTLSAVVVIVVAFILPKYNASGHSTNLQELT